MPNHVKNIIVIEAEQEKIQEILTAIKDDEKGIGTIDFNKLIPMPVALNIECGSDTDRGFKMFTDMKEKAENLMKILNNPKDVEEFIQADKESKEVIKAYNSMSEEDKILFELGKRAFENILNYNAPTWYEWSVNNWGTKWNAYDCFHSGNVIEFQTAWSPPEQIIETLSIKFPEVKMTHRWADEDLGANLGEREYLNGKIVHENIPDEGSRTAYELSFKIWHYDPEELGMKLSDDGTEYIYADEETEEGIELE